MLNKLVVRHFCGYLRNFFLYSIDCSIKAHFQLTRVTDRRTDGIGIYGMIGDERSVISALAFVPKMNLIDGK